MKWYLKCLRNYFNFSGRARRMEYWMFQLFKWIFLILIFYIGIKADISDYKDLIFDAVISFYFVGMIIPSFAVTVRRLHDTGGSGLWILIGLIPIFGSLWLIALLLGDSQPGENRWGPNPKEKTIYGYGGNFGDDGTFDGGVKR